jgi:hypothetical protein
MRQGGKNRSRGRNGRNGHKPQMPMRIQTFDSAGPDVRIRGNAWQVHERYLALARDAAAAGDRIAAENFFQHADHYYRMVHLNGEGRPQHGGHPQHQGQHPQHGHHQHHQGQPQPHQAPQQQQQMGQPPMHQGPPTPQGQVPPQMAPHMPSGPMPQPQADYRQHPQNAGPGLQDADEPPPYRAAPHPAGE